jgi:hypothetical protein
MTAPHAKTGRCLSIQQPWAWLIVNGYKGVENRDWPTKLRGWVGIHAGKKFDYEAYQWARAKFPDIPMPAPDAFDLGGIVGRAKLVGCVHEGDAHLLTARDKPWFVGAYGFILDSAEPLAFQPCRGMLGFFRPVLTGERAA